MVKCKKQYIEPDTCYISFNAGGCRVIHSESIEHETVRGEDLILDYDEQGRIIGIEILGYDKCRKPCQQAP